jgi:hypothetical protein
MASEVRGRALAAVLAASVVLAVSSTALADPSLSDRETARGLMEDGDGKRDKGDLKGALKSYEAADAIMHVPTTGLEVGRTQAAVGLLLEARETLSRVMRIPVKPNETAVLTAARKAAEQLSAEIAARIPTIVVTVANADPAQPREVLVDNEPVPAAAADVPRKVNPGEHTIVVRSGGVEKRETVTVAEREQKTVKIDLKPPAPPVQEPVQVSSSSLPTSKILIFGGFGLAAVGIGVGSVTGLMSFSKVDDVKKTCNPSCPPSQASEIDSAKSLGTISTIAFIAGGLGAAAGVVGLVMAKKEAPREGASIQPVLGPTWAGLNGTF